MKALDKSKIALTPSRSPTATVYTQVNVGNVGWVERQQNPTKSSIMLGFVPQPNLRYSGFFSIGTQTNICVYTVALRERGTRIKSPSPCGRGI